MAAKRLDVKLLLASLAIAAGVVIVVIGVSSSVTGREQQRLPDAIEEIDPISGATQVVQQSRVFVDLEIGYEAELAIDQVALETVSLDEIPLNNDGKQVTLPPVAIFEPGNATISYTPTEGGAIEQLSSGSHTATVTYWRSVEGRTHARTYTWQFYVV